MFIKIPWNICVSDTMLQWEIYSCHLFSHYSLQSIIRTQRQLEMTGEYSMNQYFILDVLHDIRKVSVTNRNWASLSKYRMYHFLWWFLLHLVVIWKREITQTQLLSFNAKDCFLPPCTVCQLLDVGWCMHTHILTHQNVKQK